MKVTMRTYPPPEGNIHIVRGGLGHWLTQEVAVQAADNLGLGGVGPCGRDDASREKACTASQPQAPYDSATRGIHIHPNSEHLASLAECFLSSAATAADPVVRPASEIKVGLSGDTTVRSKAAGLPQSELEARMSAGRVFRSSCPSPLPASALALMQALYMFYFIGNNNH